MRLRDYEIESKDIDSAAIGLDVLPFVQCSPTEYGQDDGKMEQHA